MGEVGGSGAERANFKDAVTLDSHEGWLLGCEFVVNKYKSSSSQFSDGFAFRSQDAKIGTETPAADGDAARKRPSAGDAPAPAPADKRHRPDPPSSGSHDRHRHRHSHGHGHSRPSTAGGGEKKLRASHILIKHEGSRRKASWRDPQGVAISATTRDDAADLARALREKIVAGERKFEDVATEESDCNSAKRGGDLGPFERGKMQKAFEKAVVALKVGEISDVVDTDSGVHIILRTA
uniref:Peptidyl-prolyl cis-trans isomerase n=1 Tax=Oryza punctata TaxID=4537 RepID=G9C2T5_ORYPU|nr:putative peptidy1-proly1 cis-trans isomerase [Oryza punctata]